MQVADLQMFDDTCKWTSTEIDKDNYTIASEPEEGARIVLFEGLDFFKADAIIRLRTDFINRLEGIIRQ